MTSPKIATAADLASKLPTIRWLWPGWLPIGFVTILAGNPGVGKSMCALELARSVIEPADWPDRVKGPTNQGYVLWCDTESSQALLSERITT
ncbi:MAG TPA: AAA family ATPase, partial [Candidatus Hodarchaeales archaeon]|nr:AAA family ATPase [Candidatus Hodarchaeales archaeon]